MPDPVENPTTTDPKPEPPTPTVTPPETFSREYVEQLRGEAAKYRTQKNEAAAAAELAGREKAAAEFAKQLAEVSGKHSELETKLGSANAETLKLKAALTAAFPQETASRLLAFADLLKGSTPEEIQASAAAAAKLFGGFKTNSPATDPTQGQQGQGGDRPRPRDPILAAVQRTLR